MKRLIDDESIPGSPESLLTELVRATPPFEPAPRERQRVFARVTGAAHRARGFSFRVGAGVVLVSGFAAAAAVVVDRSWVKTHRPITSVTSVALPVPPAVLVPEVSVPSIRAEDEAPVAPKASVEAPSTAIKAARRAGSNSSIDHGEDPAPVLAAIRALRYDGDAARAGTLLAEYLKAHPRSVLSEDALALSIESALARHDARSAAEFSRRYLAQFPNGRYRAFALRAAQPQ